LTDLPIVCRIHALDRRRLATTRAQIATDTLPGPPLHLPRCRARRRAPPPAQIPATLGAETAATFAARRRGRHCTGAGSRRVAAAAPAAVAAPAAAARSAAAASGGKR
jgi:hypothetical protein